MASLHKNITKYGRYLATPYVIHTADLKEQDGITHLPIYMTPFL